MRCCELLILQEHRPCKGGAVWVGVCVCQKSEAHAFGSVSDRRDAHGGENVDTPIGQFLLSGNFCLAPVVPQTPASEPPVPLKIQHFVRSLSLHNKFCVARATASAHGDAQSAVPTTKYACGG